jgi:hypothetical protein
MYTFSAASSLSFHESPANAAVGLVSILLIAKREQLFIRFIAKDNIIIDA